MGYALFTARKMSLQSNINNYNAQLTRITDKLNEITNKTAANAQKKNAADAAQANATTVANFAGDIAGFATGLPIGEVCEFATAKMNQGIDAAQEFEQQMEQNQLTAEQNRLDTERIRIETLLKAANVELQNINQAEDNAIKNATPSYVG